MGSRWAQRFASLAREALSRDSILYSHSLTDGITKHGMERSGPKHVRNVLPQLYTFGRDHHVIEVDMMNSLAGVVLASVSYKKGSWRHFLGKIQVHLSASTMVNFSLAAGPKISCSGSCTNMLQPWDWLICELGQK